MSPMGHDGVLAGLYHNDIKLSEYVNELFTTFVILRALHSGGFLSNFPPDGGL